MGSPRARVAQATLSRDGSPRDPRDAHELARSFALDEHWRPPVAAEINGQELKLVE